MARQVSGVGAPGRLPEELLPAAVLRQIGDKLYDKRKAAALEVEQIVKRLVAQNDHYRIRAIVDKLASEYANSTQANNRKGALLCLAAATVGLGAPTAAQLQTIVPSVLRSFTDQDPRVRYYACEALYNVAKVARTSFLPYFNEVFDAMFRLCADSDTNVMNAIQFLDNLVKDIVVASPTTFNLAAFIPKLRDYLPVMSPAKRSFLISWITVLDSIPDLDMLAYLPSLLDGLMGMLSDPNREIRAQAHKALLEFLVEIQATPLVDFAALGAIQVLQASSLDDFTRLTAIKWLKELVQLSATSMVGLYPSILGIILANISHSSKEISEMSRQASDVLLALAPEDSMHAPGAAAATTFKQATLALDTRAILDTISAQLLGGPTELAAGQRGSAWGGPGDASRLEALRWVELLLSRARAQVLEALPRLLPALLDALTSQSQAVADGALGVFAAIARCPGQFRHTLAALLARFRGAAGVLLLQRGGALVIRRLCRALGAEPVFLDLALELHEEKDLAFAATMVQALNLILLTSPEVRDLREALAGAAAVDGRGGRRAGSPQGTATGSSGAALFATLYPCWSHSVGALLSLCFLAQAYEHACDIIQCFRWLPLGAEVLVQLDRLVQLLDAPCFTPLRLSLLQPRSSQAVLTALHSLLMLLPQSNAFHALSTRLQAVPVTALLQLDEGLAQASSRAAAAATSAATGSAWPSPVPVAPGALLPPSSPLPSSRVLLAEPWRRPLPPKKWAAVDLPALLQVFCTRQQEHFVLELGEEAGVAPETLAAVTGAIRATGLQQQQLSGGFGGGSGGCYTGTAPPAVPGVSLDGAAWAAEQQRRSAELAAQRQQQQQAALQQGESQPSLQQLPGHHFSPESSAADLQQLQQRAGTDGGGAAGVCVDLPGEVTGMPVGAGSAAAAVQPLRSSKATTVMAEPPPPAAPDED